MTGRRQPTPTISVVVLAYNRPHLLAQALAGVRAQTRAPDEVLVIDDHSDPPLTAEGARLIRQPTNQGAGAAAARGLSEARGDMVAFLNDDDVWEPDLLSALSTALERHPSAGIAFCDHGVIDHLGVEQPERADEMSMSFGRANLPAGMVDLPRPALLDLSLATASFCLVRREVVLPELVRAGGDIWDYYVALSAVLSGRPGIYVDRRLGSYRLSPDGITASWRGSERSISARARRIAAARIAVLRRETRGIRAPLARQACRNAGAAFVLALRSASPRLLVHVARELGRAVLVPTRPPGRPQPPRPRAITLSHHVLRMVTGRPRGAG